VHGCFSGDPLTRWISVEGKPDRAMELLEDFVFQDATGTRWIAPAHYAVDGASIPRALWTLIGSPFTGDYRRASIVHDKACSDSRGDSAKRRAADRMFYRACRAGGSTVGDSMLLYLGVRIGALVSVVPAWRPSSGGEEMTLVRLTRTAEDERLEADFRIAGKRVLAAGEVDDPIEVERRTDEILSAVVGIDVRGR
jgi:hypothetical protein